MSEKEEEQLQWAIARNQPFGTAGWGETTARKYNLESTLRRSGRPCKLPKPPVRLLTLFLSPIVRIPWQTPTSLSRG